MKYGIKELKCLIELELHKITHQLTKRQQEMEEESLSPGDVSTFYVEMSAAFSKLDAYTHILSIIRSIDVCDDPDCETCVAVAEDIKKVQESECKHTPKPLSENDSVMYG